MPLPNRIILRAALVIEEIESTLAAHADDPFPPSSPPSLDDCSFPDCVEDPLEIVRQTQGDECAGHLEYYGDLECILCELEFCVQQELRSQKKTLWDVQGDASGEESDNGEGVEGS
jgi:hypothetical protein